MSERKKMFPHDPDLQEEYELMNTKGVEDGIVCEFCGTHCYQGAEHNARVEDNTRFDDPKPAAVPVEERTAEIEQLIGIARELTEIKKGWTFTDIKDAKDWTLASIAHNAWELATKAEALLKVDHIEGKAK